MKKLEELLFQASNQIVKEIEYLGHKTTKRKNLKVHLQGKAPWPFSWYMRNHPFTGFGEPTQNTDADVVICDASVKNNVALKIGDAFDKNIMLVCPSTLLVTLKTIHNIWRFEYQNRNALEIARQAGALHDQFVLFAEALEDIGDKLDKAQRAYETAHKRLSSGKGNLVGRIQRLETLGAKARKSIPETLRLDSEEEEEV